MKKEFVKHVIESNLLENDSTHVWCAVDGINAIVKHDIEEKEPFEVSFMLENNPEHELWDELYESYEEQKEQV